MFTMGDQDLDMGEDINIGGLQIISMVHMERTLLTAILLITMAMDHKDMDQAGILMDILQITTQEVQDTDEVSRTYACQQDCRYGSW